MPDPFAETMSREHFNIYMKQIWQSRRDVAEVA
jgi:hypothetical protein